jgi:DNA-binding transcriptional MerR regulator
MSKHDPEQPLSTRDVASLLDVTCDTVRWYERRGKLPARLTPSGQRIFRRGDVEEFARARASRGAGGELEPPNAA